jgi:hypothetical protein
MLFHDPSDDVDLPEERVLIAPWVDYCNEYGMGYALTDESVGVHFQDGTAVVLTADKQCAIPFVTLVWRIDPLRQALRLYIVTPPRYGICAQGLYRRGLPRRTEEQSVPSKTLRDLMGKL